MVLVLVVVALAYRRMGLLVPSFAALMAGMVIGFGLFSLVRREIVTLAFVSGAALAGLGIDYVIYVTMRGFSDPRGPSKESLLEAVGATGRPI
jgi:predicted RND superfamily exporter protein